MAKFTQLFKEIQDGSVTPEKTTFCGDLTSLQTTAQDNLVNAINEVKNSSGETATLIWSGSTELYKNTQIAGVISNDEVKKYKKLILIYDINGMTYSSICEYPYNVYENSSGIRTWYFTILGAPHSHSDYRYVPIGGKTSLIFASDGRMILGGDDWLGGLKINKADKTINSYWFIDSLSTGYRNNGCMTKLYGIK